MISTTIDTDVGKNSIDEISKMFIRMFLNSNHIPNIVFHIALYVCLALSLYIRNDIGSLRNLIVIIQSIVGCLFPLTMIVGLGFQKLKRKSSSFKVFKRGCYMTAFMIYEFYTLIFITPTIAYVFISEADDWVITLPLSFFNAFFFTFLMILKFLGLHHRSPALKFICNPRPMAEIVLLFSNFFTILSFSTDDIAVIVMFNICYTFAMISARKVRYDYHWDQDMHIRIVIWTFFAMNITSDALRIILNASFDSRFFQITAICFIPVYYLIFRQREPYNVFEKESFDDFEFTRTINDYLLLSGKPDCSKYDMKLLLQFYNHQQNCYRSDCNCKEAHYLENKDAFEEFFVNILKDYFVSWAKSPIELLPIVIHIHFTHGKKLFGLNLAETIFHSSSTSGLLLYNFYWVMSEKLIKNYLKENFKVKSQTLILERSNLNRPKLLFWVIREYTSNFDYLTSELLLQLNNYTTCLREMIIGNSNSHRLNKQIIGIDKKAKAIEGLYQKCVDTAGKFILGHHIYYFFFKHTVDEDIVLSRKVFGRITEIANQKDSFSINFDQLENASLFERDFVLIVHTSGSRLMSIKGAYGSTREYLETAPDVVAEKQIHSFLPPPLSYFHVHLQNIDAYHFDRKMNKVWDNIFIRPSQLIQPTQTIFKFAFDFKHSEGLLLMSYSKAKNNDKLFLLLDDSFSILNYSASFLNIFKVEHFLYNIPISFVCSHFTDYEDDIRLAMKELSAKESEIPIIFKSHLDFSNDSISFLFRSKKSVHPEVQIFGKFNMVIYYYVYKNTKTFSFLMEIMKKETTESAIELEKKRANSENEETHIDMKDSSMMAPSISSKLEFSYNFEITKVITSSLKEKLLKIFLRERNIIERSRIKSLKGDISMASQMSTYSLSIKSTHSSQSVISRINRIANFQKTSFPKLIAIAFLVFFAFGLFVCFNLNNHIEISDKYRLYQESFDFVMHLEMYMSYKIIANTDFPDAVNTLNRDQLHYLVRTGQFFYSWEHETKLLILKNDFIVLTNYPEIGLDGKIFPFIFENSFDDSYLRTLIFFGQMIKPYAEFEPADEWRSISSFYKFADDLILLLRDEKVNLDRMTSAYFLNESILYSTLMVCILLMIAFVVYYNASQHRNMITTLSSVNICKSANISKRKIELEILAKMFSNTQALCSDFQDNFTTFENRRSRQSSISNSMLKNPSIRFRFSVWKAFMNKSFVLTSLCLTGIFMVSVFFINSSQIRKSSWLQDSINREVFYSFYREMNHFNVHHLMSYHINSSADIQYNRTAEVTFSMADFRLLASPFSANSTATICDNRLVNSARFLRELLESNPCVLFPSQKQNLTSFYFFFGFWQQAKINKDKIVNGIKPDADTLIQQIIDFMFIFTGIGSIIKSDIDNNVFTLRLNTNFWIIWSIALIVIGTVVTIGSTLLMYRNNRTYFKIFKLFGLRNIFEHELLKLHFFKSFGFERYYSKR